MDRLQRYLRQAQALALVILFMLAGCGTEVGSADIALEAPNATSQAAPSGQGLDQSKLDVCALLPRSEVEAAIGRLVEAPKQSIAIGDEVGCDYVVDQGRSYEVSIYNLDRWDFISSGSDLAHVPGLGDDAVKARQIDGGTIIYVLVRDRAVIGISVNGADTPALRQLLALALAELPSS